MTPSRIEYQDGSRRAIITHYGRPTAWAVECQRWGPGTATQLGAWRTASDRTTEHAARRAAEQAAQAWVKGER